MKMISLRTPYLLLGFFLLCFSCTKQQQHKNILVFSKTEGFRHESIEAGKTALTKMAQEKGFDVSFTEDATQFNENNLKKYNTIVFLNTTGDILNDEQQTSFERYIQAGGGYVGIHSATDTEYDWPWYGALAGAYFLDHPSDPSNVQKGKFMVTETNWATEGMPKEFERTDEFYSYKNISPKINVVVELDNESYIGGNNPGFHPMSWYQEFDGGRAFYTGMGHTDETFSEKLFLDHLWAGINYTSGGDTPKPLDFSKAKPEENRFTKVVLKEKLDEPMELTILDDRRILFIQRKGEVLLYNILTKELKTIAKIPVSLKYVSKEGKESTAEDGLLGLNKDPNFAENHWIYLYYSPVEEPMNVLARFELDGDELLLDTKKVMLEVPTQREECCHTGGSIAWDSEGNLYLSTGDNTNPHGSSGYSPSDERDGRSAWDAQKSSANTNDLRGKILRITPQADGTYKIPAGNLFSEGTDKTRPEIYTMGHRNPFRISIDQHTGYLYWGDVGPDASKPDSTRGPAGHDEVGQAKKAGNFGWPHFVGNNIAYHKYDFENEISLPKWDPKAPINTSPNNTGLEKLPPAQNAFIWYPYAESEIFPLVGAGGRNAMAGPVYYSGDFKNAERAFPSYYDGKLLAYEWMRGWIMSVTMDEEGNLASMERFMPSYRFSNPMDMEFHENGDLYMLEYGSGWFTQNDDARLIRIEYNGGNRKPQIKMIASQMGGSVPFDLKLSAAGTTDADADELKYTWKVTSDNNFSETINTQDANLNLNDIGVYNVTLTVDDGKGGVNSQSMEVVAGNEPPVLTLDMPNSNKSFYVPNASVAYDIQVNDKEDGSLESGIDPAEVSVSIDYLAEGFDQIEIAQGHRSADASAQFVSGKKLIDGSDCVACHKQKEKSIGPSYLDVALKYKGDNNAVEYLSKKIISGGGGVWGETAMAAHPQLSAEEASDIAKYILSISNQKKDENALPTKGSFVAKVPEGDKGIGIYIVRAAYQDQGANNMPPLMAEKTFVLRSSRIDVHTFDEYVDINKMSFGGNNIAIPSKSGSYMSINQIDLSGLASVQLAAAAPKAQLNAAGGKVELRIGSPDGTLIGESKFLEASDKPGFAPDIINAPINLPNDYDGSLKDLYLVFVNDTPDNANSLMVVMGIEFKMANGKTEIVEASNQKTNKL
ncbi:ThuA domain-containing protein [Chondrinema litorale]|uniref:ThuA domain-containing protein n=1 Tax=Chondrinema litorale TaxID=2994555 RepID=UPI002542EA2A|nr:ThuA domain-containing protein [Chondrinema litorale]UZR96506.1 ThuA domain-containing protein [Chondrinema litorale]